MRCLEELKVRLERLAWTRPLVMLEHTSSLSGNYTDGNIYFERAGHNGSPLTPISRLIDLGCLRIACLDQPSGGTPGKSATGSMVAMRLMVSAISAIRASR